MAVQEEKSPLPSKLANPEENKVQVLNELAPEECKAIIPEGWKNHVADMGTVAAGGD